MHSDDLQELSVFLRASANSTLPLQPSKAIDRVWHEALEQPDAYADMCRAAGASEPVPHVPCPVDLDLYSMTRALVAPMSAHPEHWWPDATPADADLLIAHCYDEKVNPPPGGDVPG